MEAVSLYWRLFNILAATLKNYYIQLDKFTVLRLALQHIKSLLGSARPAAGAASLYKPSFVSGTGY